MNCWKNRGSLGEVGPEMGLKRVKKKWRGQNRAQRKRRSMIKRGGIWREWDWEWVENEECMVSRVVVRVKSERFIESRFVCGSWGRFREMNSYMFTVLRIGILVGIFIIQISIWKEINQMISSSNPQWFYNYHRSYNKRILNWIA